jgi:GTP-binding protein
MIGWSCRASRWIWPDDAHERLKFVPYAPLVFAAAKTKYHVNNILDHALRIYDTRSIRVATPQLNDVVRDAVQRHHPPSVQGRPMRIFYATQAETNPPTFVFFVNDPALLHFSYQRYLENQLRNVFGFEGTAIRLQFRARTTDRGEEEEKRKSKTRPGSKYTGKRPASPRPRR